MNRTKLIADLLWVVALLAIAPAFADKDLDPSKLPPHSDKQNITYLQDIKPILDKTCLKCHGESKPKADLRLDSLPHILKGGEDGKVVEPGNSARSILAYAVARTQVKAMPPKDKAPPLTREQAGLIRAWIDQGAR